MRRLARNVVALCRTFSLGVTVLVGALALVLGVVSCFGDVQARVRLASDPNAPLFVVAAEPWVIQLGTIRLDVKGASWTSVHGTHLSIHPNDWRRVSLRRSLWFQHRRSGGTSSDGTQQAFESIWVPFWIPVVVAGVIVAAWFRRHVIPARRVRAGGCVNCGYDLRASPDRCPECGTPAK